MTDLVWVALIAAVPPTIAALSALVVILRQRQVAVATKLEVEKVHVLVNSQLTGLKADLAVANHRIAELLAVIAASAHP